MFNLVIPTEKPLGFDEESTVGAPQSRYTRNTYCRSSRRSFHSLLRMTGFNGLMDQLRITRLGLSFPQTCHSDRSNEESDEKSTVYTSQSSRTRITHWRSSRRSFHSILRMTDFGGFNIYYLSGNSIKDDYLKNITPQNPSFRQRKRKVSTRNLQYVLRSQVEPKVPTGDPHVGHFIPSSG